MISKWVCDNCGFESDDEDEFIVSDFMFYCKECACCEQCREIIKDLKRSK